jgi:hypothetical protein
MTNSPLATTPSFWFRTSTRCTMTPRSSFDVSLAVRGARGDVRRRPPPGERSC